MVSQTIFLLLNFLSNDRLGKDRLFYKIPKHRNSEVYKSAVLGF